jgi:hypothetical protein
MANSQSTVQITEAISVFLMFIMFVSFFMFHLVSGGYPVWPESNPNHVWFLKIGTRNQPKFGFRIGTRTPISEETIEGKMVWKLGLMGS